MVVTSAVDQGPGHAPVDVVVDVVALDQETVNVVKGIDPGTEKSPEVEVDLDHEVEVEIENIVLDLVQETEGVVNLLL